MIEDILTNPQTASEWVWFVVSVAFVVIVALGGGSQLVLWVTARVARAQAITKKVKAEAEAWFNAVAPAGSPQQVYAHEKAVEFTKLDLVGMVEHALKLDLPENTEERLRVIEQSLDAYVLKLTDGEVELTPTNG